MIKPGAKARVVAVTGAEDAKKHLGALGFVPGVVVSIVQSDGGNMIVGIHESRLALNAELANKLMVEPL